MFNIGDMMGKFRDMQERMQEAKEKLNDIVTEAEAGGGMVRVRANANRRVLSIKIEPEIIDKNDPEMLEDLVTAAVNRALDMADAKGREEMKKVTTDLLPPGMDLGKIGF